jgi:hypothetical protein
MFDIKIKRVGLHYEAYLNGKFLVSGDTYAEAKADAEKGVEELATIYSSQSEAAATTETNELERATA